jgi:hypothetical protein
VIAITIGLDGVEWGIKNGVKNMVFDPLNFFVLFVSFVDKINRVNNIRE